MEKPGFKIRDGPIVVEVRTVNNRHFKLSAKISDSHAMIEPALEQLVREKVRRGTVQVNVRIERPHRPEDYRLNLTALASYREQLKSLRGFDERTLEISSLLTLPGVVEDVVPAAEIPLDDWPEISRVVGEALAKLEASRAQEGKAMAARAPGLGPRDPRSIERHRRARPSGRGEHANPALRANSVADEG